MVLAGRAHPARWVWKVALFKPLVRLLISKLDDAVDFYLRRQRLAVVFLIPGTLLFVLLFYAFTAAGYTALLMAAFLLILEVVLAGGTFLLQHHYGEYVERRTGVADAIESFASGTDTFDEWKDFTTHPQEDPELEALRQRCINLPREFPPDSPKEYCSAKGIKFLEACIRDLRTGFATKFFQDAMLWRAARRQRRALKAATRRHPAGVEPEAAFQSPPRAMKAAARFQPIEQEEEVVDAPVPPRPMREPSPMSGMAPTKPLSPSEPVAPSQPAAPRMSTMAPISPDEQIAVQVPAFTITGASKAPTKKKDQQPEETLRRGSPRPPAAAPAHAPVGGGMTEAAAIQAVMELGYTAHHYDHAQHRLTRQLGRAPQPIEVVTALRKQPASKKSKRVKPIHIRPSAAGLVRADIARERHAMEVRRGGGAFRVILLLATLGGLPFAVWRAPRPKSGPVTIAGVVRHQVLDQAPDLPHQARTLFEKAFKNMPVTLETGERLYVGPEDFKLCWPEPWETIYEKGYTLAVTAEARPLLFGGYGVASITNVERIEKEVPTRPAGKWTPKGTPEAKDSGVKRWTPKH